MSGIGRREVITFLGGAVVAWPLAARAGAQSYPDRPMRVIVPYAPGNLKTARALGLTISRDFLLRADEVID